MTGKKINSFDHEEALINGNSASDFPEPAHIVLLKEMNESHWKGEFEERQDVEIWHYGQKKKIPITLMRNKDTSGLLVIAEAMYAYDQNSKIDEIVQIEKARITEIIVKAKEHNKKLQKGIHINQLERKLSTPNNKILNEIYLERHRDKGHPAEWWLAEIDVTNILLSWLRSFDEKEIGHPSIERGKIIIPGKAKELKKYIYDSFSGVLEPADLAILIQEVVDGKTPKEKLKSKRSQKYILSIILKFWRSELISKKIKKIELIEFFHPRFEKLASSSSESLVKLAVPSKIFLKDTKKQKN